jgi:AraC-like DNA-binding protein/ligand-binding sensor domain-containing protein
MGNDIGLNDVHLVGNRLWLAMSNGVYLMQDTTMSCIVKGPYVNSIVPMGKQLLFCSREGVYDEKGHRRLPYNIESGYYDEMSGKLWLGGYEDGLHVVTLNIDDYTISNAFIELTNNTTLLNPIRCICPYDDETMLIGFDGEGVYQISRDGRGKCTPLFNANESNKGVLHGNGIYSMVVDTWKNIVIGSYSGGIDIARPTGSTAAIYRHLRNDSQSLCNDHVNMVTQLTDNLLLMGTDNGISILNTQTEEWQHSCQGTVVLSATRKPDGNVLVSTYGKGIYEVDSKANVSHVYTTHNSQLTDDHVYATCYDKDGGLWVGTLNGDLLHMPKNQPMTRYPVHDVQAISQLATGQMAIGTAFGLKLITPGRQEVKDLNYAPSGVTDVNPFVTHLLASGLELWIGTDGGGVYVYHQAKHESRQLTTANGLPSNYVRSLIKGADGRIWIATDQGLSFVSPDNPKTVVNANYCYGLKREYSRGAALNLPNGNIIFGTTMGAIVVHPEKVQSLNYTAKLNITGVVCAEDQEALQTEEVAQKLADGQLSLTYDQRTFEILFESVNMRNHFDIVYRYQVGDGEWSVPFDEQYIRFVNMEPGEHHLTLQCVSRTNGTIIDTKMLTIIIAQPWWNTWWMWCIYIALVILAFFGAWRVYQLHQKYLRLSIDHLQHTLPQPTYADAGKDVKEAPAENLEAKNFVDKATQLILDNLSDSEFTIDQLCREMAMSRTLFYVKLKSYTGKSPQDFIRIIRLEGAASMLRNGCNVADAAAMTGFDNPKYFSTVFKKYFGVSPSKYQK